MLIKYKKIILSLVAVIASYCNLFSYRFLFNMTGITAPAYGVAFSGYNVGIVFLFFLCIYFVYSYLLSFSDNAVCKNVVVIVIGFLMSISLVWGTYAHFKNDIFINSDEIILQVKTIFGMAIFTIPLFDFLFDKVDKCRSVLSNMETCTFKFVEKSRHKIFLYFVICWCLIFLCYLPIFLTNWPGNFIYDAKYQIRDYIENMMSTHHPILHTLLMGWAYELGMKNGNASVGFQMYTILQMLILSMAFAYFLLFLYEQKLPRLVRVVSLLWCAFFPMNQLFAITSTKDVLCASFFLIFIITLIKILIRKDNSICRECIIFVVSGVLASLFRNNMLYAIMVGGLIVALIQKCWKNKLLFLALIITTVFVTKISNRALICTTEAREVDSYRESMSVPLQCLARVASYRFDDLDSNLYDEICLYMDPKQIEVYNPYLADAVKNTANEDLMKSNFSNFMKLWIKVGLKFPGEYVEAIVTNTLGYWYPFNMGKYVSQNLNIYHTLIGEVTSIDTVYVEIEKRDYLPGFISDYYYRLYYLDEYMDVPLLGFFMRCCFYVWLPIFAFGYSISKKDKRIITIVVIPLAYLATCFLGPIVSIRYSYPLVVLTPLFLVTILCSYKMKERNINE